MRPWDNILLLLSSCCCHICLQGKLDLKSDPWPNISAEAKDCVQRMLEPNPANRATADEILQHPWMRENGVATNKPLDNVILKRMT